MQPKVGDFLCFAQAREAIEGKMRGAGAVGAQKNARHLVVSGRFFSVSRKCALVTRDVFIVLLRCRSKCRFRAAFLRSAARRESCFRFL